MVGVAQTDIDHARLLPPSSSALERAMVRTAPRAQLDVLAAAPTAVRWERPEPFAPWLASEWQLAELAPYFPNTEELIAQGLPWLRQRGSAASVKRALAWLGYTATLEQDGARLQIDPGTADVQLQLAAVRNLVAKSLPAHAYLYRMYHGYDVRPVVLDRSRLDEALLDDDSGVLVDGVKLSFGTGSIGMLPNENLPVMAGLLQTYSTRVWDDNSWRLDAFQLDSEVLIELTGGMISQQGYALEPDGEDVPIRSASDNYASVMPELDEASSNVRTDGAARALPLETRTWSGPWAGAWREAIPTRTTFEGI